MNSTIETPIFCAPYFRDTSKRMLLHVSALQEQIRAFDQTLLNGFDGVVKYVEYLEQRIKTLEDAAKMGVPHG